MHAASSSSSIGSTTPLKSASTTSVDPVAGIQRKKRYLYSYLLGFIIFGLLLLYLNVALNFSPDDMIVSLQEQSLARLADFLEEDPAHKKNMARGFSGNITTVPSSRRIQQERTEKFLYNTSDDPRPRHLRLAFFGDSVTRYQYICLAYFLKTGRWITAEDKPNILYHHEFGEWNKFFRGSNRLLQPEERCDCYLRENGKYSMGLLCENRYFYEPTRDNMLVYIQKFGFRESHGYWDPDQVWFMHINNHTRDVLYRWKHSLWHETISAHIAQLFPKPDFLVYNAGLHPHHLNELKVYQPLLQAARNHGMIPIYKTTTYPDETMRRQHFSRGAHDKFMCKVTGNCLDQTWTGDITGPEHYYDSNHFKPHINKKMNLQLLEYLNNIESKELGKLKAS